MSAPPIYYRKPEVKLVDKTDSSMKAPTWKSTIEASLRYCLSQVPKEKQSTCIGISTITLTVFICAFNFIFYMNSTSFFYLIGRDNIGDVDMLFLPSTNVLTLKQNQEGDDEGEVQSSRDMQSLIFEDHTGFNSYAIDPFEYEQTRYSR